MNELDAESALHWFRVATNTWFARDATVLYAIEHFIESSRPSVDVESLWQFAHALGRNEPAPMTLEEHQRATHSNMNANSIMEAIAALVPEAREQAFRDFRAQFSRVK